MTKKEGSKSLLSSVFPAPPALNPPDHIVKEETDEQKTGEKPAKPVQTGAKGPEATRQPRKSSSREPKAKTKAKPLKSVQKGAGAVKSKKLAKAAIDSSVDVKTTKEIKVNFNLVMTESLHKRLSFYADNYAIGRKSSVTKIINDAVEEKLLELEKKAGIRK
ncbi:hypothetical protein FY034_17670 (plasmid) [Trichlorobacter lovleyi]|uniref:hypothetical protein n=1 Tax=Trichlorobacter lovleyi TaxID=313985 RepID=UPI00223F84CC|nr:hypothetical protein [Trichlorobacter lovleyi]QOX80853.1 hypothetical protein FY034_17670 [Trichlorobacter lovleyi]